MEKKRTEIQATTALLRLLNRGGNKKKRMITLTPAARVARTRRLGDAVPGQIEERVFQSGLLVVGRAVGEFERFHRRDGGGACGDGVRGEVRVGYQIDQPLSRSFIHWLGPQNRYE